MSETRRNWKRPITFEGGFSTGSKGYNDVTPNSMSFGLSIERDYEARYDLVILSSDSYFYMKDVFSTKSGLISTNISRGDILEHNLLRVYYKFTNKYHAVRNDTIINYLTKSAEGSVFDDIPGKSQSLLKAFSFESFPESIKFSCMVIEMA